MARTVNYHLHSIQATQLAGAATIQIVQPGRVVGITLMVSFTGGAAAGYYNISVDLNNTSQVFTNTNNPPREIILTSLSFVTSTTQVAGLVGPHVPLSVPLRVGDVISLNIGQSGTAATAMNIDANVCVMEGNG
jgi:hypothetical protein